MGEQARRSGVEVRLNTPFTTETIAIERFDGVIIANGASPVTLGLSGANVHVAHAVLEGEPVEGESVVVIGGGLVGLEVADGAGDRRQEGHRARDGRARGRRPRLCPCDLRLRQARETRRRDPVLHRVRRPHRDRRPRESPGKPPVKSPATTSWSPWIALPRQRRAHCRSRRRGCPALHRRRCRAPAPRTRRHPRRASWLASRHRETRRRYGKRPHRAV